MYQKYPGGTVTVGSKISLNLNVFRQSFVPQAAVREPLE
jgi:hypothetical protein